MLVKFGRGLEPIAICVVGVFGLAGITIFTLEHLSDYFEIGGLAPLTFGVIMLGVVLPCWLGLVARDLWNTRGGDGAGRHKWIPRKRRRGRRSRREEVDA